MKRSAMKARSLALLVLSATLAPLATAQNVLVYDGSSLSPSTTTTGLTVGPMTASNPRLDDFTTAAEEYSASDWTTDPSPNADSTFSFTVAADAGYIVNLTLLSFSYKAQGSGPDQIAAAYTPSSFVSRAQWGNPIITGAYQLFLDHPLDYSTRNATGNYTHAGNLTFYGGETYTFYILGFDAHNPGKSLTVDNIVLQGTVSAVPEPGTYALLVGGVALAGVLLRRRRSSV
jgi:hypothetical protein